MFIHSHTANRFLNNIWTKFLFIHLHWINITRTVKLPAYSKQTFTKHSPYMKQTWQTSNTHWMKTHSLFTWSTLWTVYGHLSTYIHQSNTNEGACMGYLSQTIHIPSGLLCPIHPKPYISCLAYISPVHPKPYISRPGYFARFFFNAVKGINKIWRCLNKTQGKLKSHI